MRKLENYLNIENLNRAKPNLVPHVFSQNYFNIIKLKLEDKKLSVNQRYYYNHFIKKKIEGIFELLDVNEEVHGKEFILKNRLSKANKLLKKYSRKHKNMKILISGSFLYNERYNDVDVFVISKYDKEDYREGKVHVNYLPANIEKTLFFKSISAISVSNFKSKQKIEEKIDLKDLLSLYELVVLLILQKDDYLSELRNLILDAEYVSNHVVLNSMQLKRITNKIIKSKDPIKIINKYLISKIISSYSAASLKKTIKKFIKKNKVPEKGKKVPKNWKIYNTTYQEVLESVS